MRRAVWQLPLLDGPIESHRDPDDTPYTTKACVEGMLVAPLSALIELLGQRRLLSLGLILLIRHLALRLSADKAIHFLALCIVKVLIDGSSPTRFGGVLLSGGCCQLLLLVLQLALIALCLGFLLSLRLLSLAVKFLPGLLRLPVHLALLVELLSLCAF